jgi:hypothetical protein
MKWIKASERLPDSYPVHFRYKDRPSGWIKATAFHYRDLKSYMIWVNTEPQLEPEWLDESETPSPEPEQGKLNIYLQTLYDIRQLAFRTDYPADKILCDIHDLAEKAAEALAAPSITNDLKGKE